MGNQISITRALAEVKNLEKRIEKILASFSPVTISVGTNPPVGYETVVAYYDDVRSTYQSLLDLIARRSALKSAIIRSNADTMVEVAGKKMSVAEAIDMKSAIQLQKAVASRVSHQLALAENKLTLLERDADNKLQTQLNTLLGSDRKSDDAERTSIEASFKERNWPKLRDPLGAREKAATLSDFVEDFSSNVDFVLSESNARTTIEVNK